VEKKVKGSDQWKKNFKPRNHDTGNGGRKMGTINTVQRPSFQKGRKGETVRQSRALSPSEKKGL